MKKLFFAVFMLLLFLSAGESRLARADAVTDWNANAPSIGAPVLMYSIRRRGHALP